MTDAITEEIVDAISGDSTEEIEAKEQVQSFNTTLRPDEFKRLTIDLWQIPPMTRHARELVHLRDPWKSWSRGRLTPDGVAKKYSVSILPGYCFHIHI